MLPPMLSRSDRRRQIAFDEQLKNAKPTSERGPLHDCGGENFLRPTSLAEIVRRDGASIRMRA